MRQIFIKFILFYIAVSFISCNHVNRIENSKPKITTISGRIINFDQKTKQIDFVINRIGSLQESIPSEIDDFGYFSLKFECYVPTETYISYKTNISVLSNPGDSIFLSFDGSKSSSQDILQTISFSGDAIEINRECSKFKELFYSSRIDEGFRYEKIKNLDPNQYIKFEDSLRKESIKLFNHYSSKNILTEESKHWIIFFIDNQYIYPVNYYPYYHGILNSLDQSEWDVPIDYFAFLNERLPITKEDFFCGDALSTYINCYRAYAYKKTMHEQTKVHGSPSLEKLTESEMDSITVYGIIEHTNDNLLKQLILSEFFNSKLKNSKPNVIERFHSLIIENVTEQFLFVPLLQEYEIVNERVKNPKLSTDLMIKKINTLSIKSIIDTILNQNKNKVILIDCWATWCSPCLSEFPYSNKLMDTLKGQDIEFVFLCIQSNDTAWKAVLSKYKMGGQHYFLNSDQSEEFISLFNINGVPHYMLFGKSGEIIEQGSHLRPSDNITIQKIELLLRKNVP